MKVVCLQPFLCSRNDLIELFRLRIPLQCGLAFVFLNPEDGIIGIGIDGLVVKPLIPAKGKGMNDGEKLSDVIGAMNGTKVEHTLACLQIDSLVLHGSGIAGAGCIHSPCIGTYFHRQWTYGVVAVIGRVLSHHLLTISLHSLWNFDTQQAHAILDDLGYVLRQHQTEESLLLIWFVQDGVVMIELVEHLCELVAVVGDA